MVRYKDWLSHIESFRGVPKVKERYDILGKRLIKITLSASILLLQDKVLDLMRCYISGNMVFMAFGSVVIALLAWWPLVNNLLFLGSDWIASPGIELCNKPVLLSSPIDYWRRQQLGVATFFRENVYNNTWGGGERSRYRNLFYTFALIGLWHGLTFQWAVWGILWGVVMVLNRYYRQHWRGSVINRLGKTRWVYHGSCWILTILLLILFQLILHRDPSLPWILGQH